MRYYLSVVVLCALAIGLLLVLSEQVRTYAWQGTVKGRVELINVKTKGRNWKIDASGVVVSLESPAGARPRSTGHTRRTLTQRDKLFIPHVMAVEVGTEVHFPNEDPFFHNVFSIFNGKRFDLGLYASGESRPVYFNRPGVSYIFCNIHPQMSAVVLALNTPYFAVSDPGGNFSISVVPEGNYRLQVWHERATAQQLAAQARGVRVGSAGTDLGIIRLSEEGYIPRPHQNKYGEDYDLKRNKPTYRKP
jgi:plastocyanin